MRGRLMSDQVKLLLSQTLAPVFAAHAKVDWVWFCLNCPPCSLRLIGDLRAKDAFKKALRGISEALKAGRSSPLESVRVFRDGKIL